MLVINGSLVGMSGCRHLFTLWWSVVPMRSCKICKMGNTTDAINELLLANYSVNSVAKTFGVSEATLRRHKKNCLPEVKTIEGSLNAAVTKPKPKTMTVEQRSVRYRRPESKKTTGKASIKKEGASREVHEGKTLKELIVDGTEISTSKMSSNIKYLFAHSVDILRISKEEGLHELRLKAIREARSTLELVVKASTVFMQAENQEEWRTVLNRVLSALGPYEDAKDAVINALDK